MALDESKENDTVVELEGITFVADSKLAGYIPVVTIGYRNSWLGTGLYVQAGGSGC